MAYITKFNVSRILRKHDLNNSEIDEELYDRSIYFFNRFEKNELIAFKSFLKNPENFVEHYYRPIDVADSKIFVFEYEGKKPSYHKVADCYLLHQDYRNIKIPNPIKDAGIHISEFRRWFITELKTAFERGAYDVIQERIRLKYGVNVSQQDFVHYENSNVEDFNNYSIENLKKEIDLGIRAAGKFYNENISILKIYSLRTFIAYRDAPIEDNMTELSDRELKSFLKHYNETYKVPVKKMLKEWFRLQYNPDNQINGTILEKLNFKADKHCYGDDEPGEPIDLGKFPFNSNEFLSDEFEHLQVNIDTYSNLI